MSINDINKIINKWIGRPFKYSEKEWPDDCSRFIQEVMIDLEIKIPNSIEEQKKQGKEVERKDMILGDCIYFGNDEEIKYIGLYIGNNTIIYPSLIQEKVIKDNIDSQNNIKTIRRFLHKYLRGQLIFETRTPLKNIPKSCKFFLGDYNGNKIMDLFCIKNGDNYTDIHVLNSANNFKSLLRQFQSPLHKFDNGFEFKIGNFEEGKPNIYCIKKNKTGSNSTEIHILSGDNDYQSFIFNKETALHETDDNWNFGVGEYNNNGKYNIYCIHKKNTDSKYTEIQILDGNNDYQSFLEPKIITTSLHETDNNWEFLLRDYNHDGNLDLYCINKNGENNSTEVIILSGKSKFKECILKVNLCLYYCDDNFQFCAGVYGGYECIFGLKKNEILEIYIFTI